MATRNQTKATTKKVGRPVMVKQIEDDDDEDDEDDDEEVEVEEVNTSTTDNSNAKPVDPGPPYIVYGSEGKGKVIKVNTKEEYDFVKEVQTVPGVAAAINDPQQFIEKYIYWANKHGNNIVLYIYRTWPDIDLELIGERYKFSQKLYFPPDSVPFDKDNWKEYFLHLDNMGSGKYRFTMKAVHDAFVRQDGQRVLYYCNKIEIMDPQIDPKIDLRTLVDSDANRDLILKLQMKGIPWGPTARERNQMETKLEEMKEEVKQIKETKTNDTLGNLVNTLVTHVVGKTSQPDPNAQLQFEFMRDLKNELKEVRAARDGNEPNSIQISSQLMQAVHDAETRARELHRIQIEQLQAAHAIALAQQRDQTELARKQVDELKAELRDQRMNYELKIDRLNQTHKETIESFAKKEDNETELEKFLRWQKQFGEAGFKGAPKVEWWEKVLPSVVPYAAPLLQTLFASQQVATTPPLPQQPQQPLQGQMGASGPFPPVSPLPTTPVPPTNPVVSPGTPASPQPQSLPETANVPFVEMIRQYVSEEQMKELFKYHDLLKQIEQPLLLHINGGKSGLEFADLFIGDYGRKAYDQIVMAGPNNLKLLLGTYRPIATVVDLDSARLNQFINEFLTAGAVFDAEETEEEEPEQVVIDPRATVRN